MPNPPSFSAAQNRVRSRIMQELGLTPFIERCEQIDLGELPIHCEIYRFDPSAPTIIFLPGIGTYSQLYCELLARMSDQGFNMVAVDLRGHGLSGGDRGGYRVAEVIDDIKQVIDYLEQDFSGPIGLYGCSIGSRLALAVAEEEPRIQALLCHTLFLSEVPPDIWHSLGWNSLSFSNLFTPYLKVNMRTFVDIDSLLAHNPMGKYADQDPLLVWDYPIYTLHSVYNYPSKILKQELNIPSAIIIGSKDDVLNTSYTEKIVDKSMQPFELIVIEDGSHMLPFDHIDDTLAASCQWFDQAFLQVDH